MPNSGEKAAHSGYPGNTGHHGHHEMHGPHGPQEEKAEDNHELLKGRPFPLTSKPTHTNDEKPPMRFRRRKG